MLVHAESFDEVAAWHGETEVKNDAMAYLVNPQNPIFSRFAESNPQAYSAGRMSETSYLGYLPLLLISIGLFTPATRRRMAPWVFLCALFLILRLGSHLAFNGVVFTGVPLPKYYLNQLLPIVFSAFWEADLYMIGALLPLAVLSCFGLVALKKRSLIVAKPVFILALVAIVALEYHIPIRTDRIFPVGDAAISNERLAFLDWLESEETDRIRLINLPMGRPNSKLYNLYQSLSGYPHAEGAISRTPDSAFDYIRANPLLNAWHQQQPISCELVDRNAYLADLAQLEADGFSHIVRHRSFYNWENVIDSFKSVVPAYDDDFVSIYRLRDLKASCPAAADDT